MRSFDVVLFHSAIGRHGAVVDWAEQLTARGMTVHTPDLYDGRVFHDLQEGIDCGNSIGIPELLRRADEALAPLPTEIAYLGFSGGAAAAEQGVVTRPGALGAVFMHGALPVEPFGAAAWPAGVPAQVHYAEHDPWVDVAQVDALEREVEGAGGPFERHVYPGSAHLFADPAGDEFEPEPALLMWERVLEFLEGL